MQDYLGKYEEINQMEKNRDRNEYRTCQICNNASNLTKKQKEWPHVQSIGRIKQVRIPVEKDSQGNDITPTKEEFLKKGSRRVPVPSAEEGGNWKRHPVYGTDLRPYPHGRGTGKHKKNALVYRSIINWTF